MPKTAFDPKTDGFAFRNSWQFSAAERRLLHTGFARTLILGGILGAAVLGPVGAALVLCGICAIREAIETRLSGAAFGLCGGMSFAALDYYKSQCQVPRRQGPGDWPPPGDLLRDHLWRRQVDSFVGDLARLYAWVILLNCAPAWWPLRGGAGGLLARTKKEWDRMKLRLDAGNPVPLMLVRDTLDPFKNHQVLVTGYEQTDENNGTIYLYDPNCPGKESTIRVEFGGRRLNAWEDCSKSDLLRGFFCETYTPHSPPEVIG